MQQLEGFQQPGGVTHPGDSQAREQGVVKGIGTRQRPGMADGGARSQRRAAGLERHQWHTPGQRTQRDLGKSRNVVQPFDMQPDRTDPVVLQQGIDDGLDAGTGLVAYCHQLGQRQVAPLHREVERDVAALRDDGHTAAHPFAAMLIRPQGHTVEVVQHAITVGPDQWHGTGRCHQAALQRYTGATDLGKSRGVADHATGATRSELGDDVDGTVAGHCDEAGIGRLGQGRHVAVTRVALNLSVARMHRPDSAIKTERAALAHHLGGGTAAEHRHMAWRKQSPQPFAGSDRHGTFRTRARATWRAK
jgi:hypothetical protein